MLVAAKKVSRQFLRKREDSNVFFPVRELDFSFGGGELVVIDGASGSGKSTLMSMLAGLLRPTDGEIIYRDSGEAPDMKLYGLNDRELAVFRNRHIGVVPQGQTAISSLTLRENILLPYTIYGGMCRKEKKTDDIAKYADELMGRLGIAELGGVMTSELSGGEQRRMAVARALIRKPEVVMADEPTADLDEVSTRLVMELLKEKSESGSAVLVVTHDRDVMPYADTMYHMDGGVLTMV